VCVVTQATTATATTATAEAVVVKAKGVAQLLLLTNN